MNRNRIIIKTSILGIITNILLVTFKAIIGLIANSISIILDAVNNLTDALSSIITIIGAKLSSKEPDKKHPYGYGRIEYIASVIIALIVLIAGITSLKESILKIITPTEAKYSIVSLIIIIVAIIVKFFYGRYVKSVGETINSQSLIASGTDAFMDSILSFSTLVGAVVSLTLHINIEGYLGLLISIFIIKTSIEILTETLNSIIGVRADSELTHNIKKVINKFKEVEGTYDLTIHNYGPSQLIGTVHIQVDDNMTAKEIHVLTRKIQTIMLTEFGMIMTVGIYASNTSNKEYLKIKEDLIKIIKKYKDIIQLHGFYVEPESNLITFDIIIDFDIPNAEEIKDKVKAEIKEKYPKYNYYVILDRDFSD